MSTLLRELDPAVTATIFGAAMLASWAIGRRCTQPLSQDEDPEGSNKLNDGIMSILGLLLAFTFSMALVKHEQRRQAAVADSNAIADLYTCAGLLTPPVRGELQAILRQYVEHRLSLAATQLTEAEFEGQLSRIEAMHDEMQRCVQQALNDGTAVVVPLVNALNGVMSSHAARLAAVRDRLPPSIVWLLFACAVLTMAATGRRHGLKNKWRPGSTLAYTAIVAAVVWVSLDLNQPQRGAITISQEPLQRLLHQMRADASPRESAPSVNTTSRPSTSGK